jgi:hypothetical protein
MRVLSPKKRLLRVKVWSAGAAASFASEQTRSFLVFR